jgi:hypothetical protein
MSCSTYRRTFSDRAPLASRTWTKRYSGSVRKIKRLSPRVSRSRFSFAAPPRKRLRSSTWVTTPLQILSRVQLPGGGCRRGCVFLSLVGWAKFRPIFDQGKLSAVQIVKFRGLSAECELRKIQKGAGSAAIRRQFEFGTFKVPCSKLEFRDFDESLDAAIRRSHGRRVR